MTTIPGTNSGHGHVFPRPDGVKARCGGPAICPECAHDCEQLHILAAQRAVAPTEAAGCPNSAAPASTLSKRELIALVVVHALLSDTARTGTMVDYTEDAVVCADALLKELAKERAP